MQQSRQNQGCLSWFCFKTWYPFSTLRSVLILSLAFGVVFLSLGILQASFYLTTHEYEVIYASNEGCTERANGATCESIIQITKDLKPPIAFVYYIENAYINHRRYINSVSPNQLAGQIIDLNTANKECTPFVTNQNMQQNKSYTGVSLDPKFIASPCGFTSHLVFNDTYSLFDDKNYRVPINQSGLFQNIYGQFKKPVDSQSSQWIDSQNGHFMVWMKNSGLITKFKLWGRIDQPLPAGKYNLVANNNYQIGAMKLKRGVKIISLSPIGSPVYSYPVAFALMGVACIAYAIFMKIKFPDYDDLLSQFNAMEK